MTNPDLPQHTAQGIQRHQTYDYTEIMDRIRLRLDALKDRLPHLSSDELELVEEDLDRCARIAKLFTGRKQPPTADKRPAPTVAGHERRTAPHGQGEGFDGTKKNPMPLDEVVDLMDFPTLIKLANKLGVPHNVERWIDDDYPDKEDELRVAVAEAMEKIDK